ncbi:MAG TPA: gliding motility-associated C-terminal domain-containing protein [Sphingobacteriaceae bacterium]
MTRQFFFMKYLLPVLALLLFVRNSRAQSAEPSVINAAGQSYSGNELIFEWSVGEMALVESMMGTEGTITNGLLQQVLPAHMILSGFVVFPTNILTPNGDGTNDNWIVKDLDRYPDNELTIVNRAGQVVYKAQNYQNNWNGTFEGRPLPKDSYFYIIKLKKDGRTSLVKGFITIVH